MARNAGGWEFQLLNKSWSFFTFPSIIPLNTTNGMEVNERKHVTSALNELCSVRLLNS